MRHRVCCESLSREFAVREKFPYARLHYGFLSETSNSRSRLFSALPQDSAIPFPLCRSQVYRAKREFPRAGPAVRAPGHLAALLGIFRNNMRGIGRLYLAARGKKGEARIRACKTALPPPLLSPENRLNNFVTVGISQSRSRAKRRSNACP